MQPNKIFHVGLAGCGAIGASYLNSAPTFFKSFRIYSCCDALPERANATSDMANAIRENRPHRCNGDIAYHILEVMLAIRKSARERRIVDIESTCERMQPLAPNGCPGDVD